MNEYKDSKMQGKLMREYRKKRNKAVNNGAVVHF